MRPTLHLLTRVLPTVAIASMLACESPPSIAPLLASYGRGTPELHLYGQGAKGGLITACQAPGYRQFDFWVGRWTVRSIRPDGTLNPEQPSVIERELDGCVIEENWTGTARSINTYDAAAGTYHQQYIDVSGNHMLLTGGAGPDGSMEMTGTTYFACTTCPNGIFPLINIWQWTTITPDSVRQLNLQINGLTGKPWQTGVGFDGRYRRDESATLRPTPSSGTCTSNPLYRQADFVVGDWVITSGEAVGRDVAEGRGPVTATVTGELAGCLIEERVHGPGGYSGWSFNGWNQSEDVWVRTYADNLGDRVFLRGTLDGTRLVLSGTRSRASGEALLVRMTWEAVTPDRVVETWAVSRDGGATYEVEKAVVRIRRAM